MHGNPSKEDSKGHSKSGPNGLNKNHPTGVGATRRSWCFWGPHRARGVKNVPYLIDRHPKILGNRMDSEGVYASNGVKTKSDPEVALLSAVHPLN